MLSVRTYVRPSDRLIEHLNFVNKGEKGDDLIEEDEDRVCDNLFFRDRRMMLQSSLTPKKKKKHSPPTATTTAAAAAAATGLHPSMGGRRRRKITPVQNEFDLHYKTACADDTFETDWPGPSVFERERKHPSEV